MAKGFRVVSPDLNAPDPLQPFTQNTAVRQLTELYAQHVDADPTALPLVPDRYTGGLYGGPDPGVGMAAVGLPQLAQHPEHGIIMVATERR